MTRGFLTSGLTRLNRPESSREQKGWLSAGLRPRRRITAGIKLTRALFSLQPCFLNIESSASKHWHISTLAHWHISTLTHLFLYLFIGYHANDHLSVGRVRGRFAGK